MSGTLVTDVVVALAVAGLVTGVAIFFLDFLAHKFHLLLDEPAGRKQHDASTSVIGGVGITLGLLSLYFTVPEVFMKHWVVFASVVVLMVVGIIDDIKHIHSALRMFIQIAIGCAIHFEGNLPFLSVGDIWFVGDLGLGPYSLTFTCIAVVGGVNAINMMDGLDGLCGGIVAVTLAFLVGMSYVAGREDVFVISSVLFIAVFVFLLFNSRFPWNPKARVFMGDSGAYVLGFMIAALFLMASQGYLKNEIQVLSPVTALWLLLIPLIDIAGVIWRRSRVSRWPVDDDREHLHYMLVDRGYSDKQVVNGIILAAIGLAGLGTFFYYVGVTESWSYVVFMTICVLYFRVTNWMAYKEGPFRY